MGVWMAQTVLSGPDGFGEAVDIEEGGLVVGAPGVSEVHVFQHQPEDSWTLDQVLSVSSTSCLGKTVALEGDRIAAGDPCASDTVHLFQADTEGWTQEASLSEAGEPSFGRALSMSGDTIVVGSGGEAYVFEHDGSAWSSSATLEPTSDAPNFGVSVAVDGAVGAVGSWGAVSIYRAEAGEWREEARLGPADASPLHINDRFGQSIDLSGETIAVGAPKDDGSSGSVDVPGTIDDVCVSQFGFGACLAQRPGAVYVFETAASGWSQATKLTADVAGQGQFGAAVDLDTDESTLLVGSPGELRGSIGGVVDVDAEDSVHVFQRTV